MEMKINLNKRKRSGNWLDEDKTLLKELVKENVADIENKNTDTNTNQMKKKAWLDLEESFNTLCKGEKRNVSQLKAQWTFIKIQAKKENASHRREIYKTGGGPQPSEKEISANDISVWLPNEFIVETNEFDSDFINPEISASVEKPSPEGLIECEESTERITTELETDSIIEFLDEEEYPIEERECKRKRKVPAITQNVANSKIRKIAELQIKCREELHVLQMERERKKIRNLDLQYELMQEKIKFFKRLRNGMY